MRGSFAARRMTAKPRWRFPGAIRRLRHPARPMPDLQPDDDSPGLPGFRTWRGVYLFVMGCFVAVVVLLTVFSRWFA